MWEMLAPQLEELGLLTQVDGGALESACVNYARAVDADAIVKKKGLVIKTPFGPKTNPAISISLKSWNAFRMFATEFGLTPASRSRLNAPAKPVVDDVEREIFGRLAVVQGGKGV